MKKALWIIFLLPGLVFSSCKTSPPEGTQIAEPIKVAFLKGPFMTGIGRMYFLEDRAVYKPVKSYPNFQKVSYFPYAEIDTAEKVKLFIILPLVADLKMHNGKRYKLRVNKKISWLILSIV